MKARDILNHKYALKCQELADLMLNKEKIEAKIQKLKADIEVLNSSLPVCEEVEKFLKQDNSTVKETEVVKG